MCICQEGKHLHPKHNGQVVKLRKSHTIFYSYSIKYITSKFQKSIFNYCFQPELFWTHHWQKNITIPEIKRKDKQEYWEDRFPEDDISDTSSRDYPRLYLESDYGNRTDREGELETDLERATEKNER